MKSKKNDIIKSNLPKQKAEQNSKKTLPVKLPQEEEKKKEDFKEKNLKKRSMLVKFPKKFPKGIKNAAMKKVKL